MARRQRRVVRPGGQRDDAPGIGQIQCRARVVADALVPLPRVRRGHPHDGDGRAAERLDDVQILRLLDAAEPVLGPCPRVPRPLADDRCVAVQDVLCRKQCRVQRHRLIVPAKRLPAGECRRQKPRRLEFPNQFAERQRQGRLVGHDVCDFCLARQMQRCGGWRNLRVQLADKYGKTVQVALPNVGVLRLLFQRQNGLLAGQVAALDDVAARLQQPRILEEPEVSQVGDHKVIAARAEMQRLRGRIEQHLVAHFHTPGQRDVVHGAARIVLRSYSNRDFLRVVTSLGDHVDRSLPTRSCEQRVSIVQPPALKGRAKRNELPSGLKSEGWPSSHCSSFMERRPAAWRRFWLST